MNLVWANVPSMREALMDFSSRSSTIFASSPVAELNMEPFWSSYGVRVNPEHLVCKFFQIRENYFKSLMRKTHVSRATGLPCLEKSSNFVFESGLAKMSTDTLPTAFLAGSPRCARGNRSSPFPKVLKFCALRSRRTSPAFSLHTGRALCTF